MANQNHAHQLRKQATSCWRRHACGDQPSTQKLTWPMCHQLRTLTWAKALWPNIPLEICNVAFAFRSGVWPWNRTHSTRSVGMIPNIDPLPYSLFTRWRETPREDRNVVDVQICMTLPCFRTNLLPKWWQILVWPIPVTSLQQSQWLLLQNVPNPSPPQQDTLAESATAHERSSKVEGMATET